jgi:PAS domain S-box-containing protein
LLFCPAAAILHFTPLSRARALGAGPGGGQLGAGMGKLKTAGARDVAEEASAAHLGSRAILESLEAFREIADGLAGVSRVEAICDRVVQVLKARLGLKTCSVMLLADDGETLENVAGTSPRPQGEAPPAVHRTFRVGEGIAGLAAQTGEPILVPDAAADARFRGGEGAGPVRSLLCLPIPGPAAPMGVLNLSHARPGFFGDEHRTVFGILATILGNVLAEARLTEELARFNRDLEDQVAARTREIQASHAYLEQILTRASDIILTVDWRGRITYVNDRVERLGRTPDQVLGQPFSALCEGGRLPAALTDALAGRTAPNVPLALLGPQGGRVDTYCGFSPMSDREGGAPGALVFVRDVTEVRALETQLRQVEKLTAVGTLVAGIAHEINNKLVPILVYSELLDRAGLPDRQGRLIHTVHKSAVGARQIMDSLLRFSRQEVPNKALSDLNEVVGEVVGMVRYRTGEQRVDLTTELATGLPATRMDAHQIAQVILNLLNNACDALEDGGAIHVGTALRDDTLHLWVEDDGPGIDAAAQSRIFDPFFTTKEVGKGTGLGLSLCYGIVQEHGGHIRVESRPGRTRFEVVLPVVTEAAPGPRPAPAGAEPSASRARVLVADDDPALLEVLDHVLGDRHDVVRVRCGNDVVARLAADPFDVVILDLNMPDMDGAEVLGWIESHRPELARRVVMMTGSATDLRHALGDRLPADRLLRKPFRVAEVQASVDAVLAGAERGGG